MSHSPQLPAIIVSLTIAVSLCGCGGNEKEVSFKSNGMTQTFSIGSAADIKDFPLPIYPNAEPSGEVQANGDADDNSKFLMLASADNIEQISNYYNKELASQGWKVNENVKQAALVNLGAKKNDLDASIVISTDEGGKSTISLAVSKETAGVPKMSNETYTPDKLNPPTD